MLLMEVLLGITGQAALLPAVTLQLRLVLVLCAAAIPAAAGGVRHRPAARPAGLPAVLGVGTLPKLPRHRRCRAPVDRVAWFRAVWLCSHPIALAAALLMWLLVALLTFRLLSPAPALFQAVVTIVLYPALAVPLGAAQRSITSPERV